MGMEADKSVGKVLFDLLMDKKREEIDPDLVSRSTRGLLESLVERTRNDPVLTVPDGICAAMQFLISSRTIP